jgi:hypothetical protein
MKNYSIVRVGNEYVLRAGERGILKVASRRKAARLVSLAAELLNSQVSLPSDDVPSIAADAAITDPEELPNPSTADLQIVPDLGEVS